MARARERDADKPISTASREPWVRLAGAVLKQAVIEAQAGDMQAARWLLSDEARAYCEWLGIDVRQVERWMLSQAKLERVDMDYKQASKILDEAIKRVSRERGIDYPAAYMALLAEKPELFKVREKIWRKQTREQEQEKLKNVSITSTGVKR